MRERELAFPFRRYQIQRVWRGETPQARKGRFREFYQCDIDIINRDQPELSRRGRDPERHLQRVQEMAIGEFRIRINNRKLLKGLLQHSRCPRSGAPAVLRALDKIDKEDAVDDPRRAWSARALSRRRRAPAATSSSPPRRTPARRSTRLRAPRRAQSEMLRAGLDELRRIVARDRRVRRPGLGLLRRPERRARPRLLHRHDLRDDAPRHPELGSICSGGRYDDLASYFTDTRLPGVGISIGLTRLFSKLKEAGLLRPLPSTPARGPRHDHGRAATCDEYLAMAR